jgi:hypothetical protein
VMVLLTAALSVGIPSISWVIERWVSIHATQQLAREALRECPPGQRANILRAVAEIAGKVNASRPPGKYITLFQSGRRSGPR